MGRRPIDRARIANDVRTGATDTSIMERYELSKEELYSYYDDLVKEGRLAMSDLLGDLPPAPEPGLMLVEECPVCGTHNLVDTERCASCGSTLPGKPGRLSGGSSSPKPSEPIKITVHDPNESPEHEVTDWARGSLGTSGEQVVLVEEDATVDLDTVLDDFAGVGSGIHGFAGTDDSAWAVTTSGQDILEAIESIPSPADTDSRHEEVDADEINDSVTVQTELSLDDILNLASEAGATGAIDGEVPNQAGEAQQLDFDFDFDQTIALVHRENLLRKRKDILGTGERNSLEPETTVDGLITLSSEIEVPKDQEPGADSTPVDLALDCRSQEVVPHEESQYEYDRGAGLGLETAAETAGTEADLDVIEMDELPDLTTTVADGGTTGQRVPYFEPTVRLDTTTAFDFDADDVGITSEGEVPDDDVDLDFTLVKDLKIQTGTEPVVDSDERTLADFEATAPLESEFTFNLDDPEDEQPQSTDEHVAMSFDDREEEQEAQASVEEVPLVPVLRDIRDTQLLETQALSQYEEFLTTTLEELRAAEPQEKSGTLKLIIAASVLFILVGLGGLATYTGFVTVPSEIFSHLPSMGKDENTKSSVDRGQWKQRVRESVPTVKQGHTREEQPVAKPIEPPTVKMTPGNEKRTAALPTESRPDRSAAEVPRESAVRPKTRTQGKRRPPGLSAPTAMAPGLVEAVRRNDGARVILLLDRGSDVNGKDAAGATPLTTAVEQANESLVELLLKHGANPNEKNRNGDTPLMIAAQKGRVRVVRALLNAGADPREVNSEGRTVLNQVFASGPTLFVPMQACREIVRLIREQEERPAFARGR